jgi:AraC-like DNA-binding protein
MPKFSHTILARFPLLLLERAERMGADRAALLRRSGLTEANLTEPDARIAARRHWDLWRNVIEQLPDPALGVRLGAQVHIRQAGLVGYAMLHSESLDHAIERMIRYERILEDTTYLAREVDGDRVRLVVDEPLPLVGLRQPIEADVAAMVTCFREITGVRRLPLKVCLPYPRPTDLVPYRDVLGEAIEFDAKRATIVFAAEDMALPVVAQDDTLCSYLDEHADRVLADLTSHSYAERVQRVLWEQMSEGQPTIKTVARALGASTRTLQRRLREEGVGFAELLDTFRRRMAAELLQRHDLAVYEIAFLLGYSEPSTFFRAFRRWTGMSPLQYRAAPGH